MKSSTIRAAAVAATLFLAGVAFAEGAEPVRVDTKEGSGRTVLVADNDLACPVTVLLDFTKLDNVAPPGAVPLVAVVPANARGRTVAELAAVDPKKGTAFGYRWRWELGDATGARHAPDGPYLPPFAHGMKFKMIQAFDGSFSHFGAERYAVDFDMPEGTEIRAGRGGLVARVKEDSDRGGPTRDFAKDGNYVYVLHDDGSFGVYIHFRKDGVAVSPGQKVKRGDLIGYSGNTGFSDTPHLHFAVMLPTLRGEQESVPFAFADRNGLAVDPREGAWYLSAHPGMPAPDAKLGAELTAADYADYRAKAAPADEPELRSETVDDTVVLFLDNGTGKELTVEVTLTLTNMTTAAKNPVIVRVSAGEGAFVAVLQPVDPAEAYKWRANYSW